MKRSSGKAVTWNKELSRERTKPGSTRLIPDKRATKLAAEGKREALTDRLTMAEWQQSVEQFKIECVNCKATRQSFTAMANKYGAGAVPECCVLSYPGEPPTRVFVDASGQRHYVRGISKAELAWHQSRQPQPVTGSAFALDPTAIHECDDVVAQLQKEEDDGRDSD